MDSVCGGFIIHRLNLCRGGEDFLNECPIYDIKESDGETPVILELWGMQSTSSLPSLPDTFWPGVLITDRFLSMGQIEPFDIKSMYLC